MSSSCRLDSNDEHCQWKTDLSYIRVSNGHRSTWLQSYTKKITGIVRKICACTGTKKDVHSWVCCWWHSLVWYSWYEWSHVLSHTITIINQDQSSIIKLQVPSDAWSGRTPQPCWEGCALDWWTWELECNLQRYKTIKALQMQLSPHLITKQGQAHRAQICQEILNKANKTTGLALNILKHLA